MGKLIENLKLLWVKLVALCDDEERMDEFYEAVNMICSECDIRSSEACSDCRVTKTKIEFVNKFKK